MFITWILVHRSLSFVWLLSHRMTCQSPMYGISKTSKSKQWDAGADQKYEDLKRREKNVWGSLLEHSSHKKSRLRSWWYLGKERSYDNEAEILLKQIIVYNLSHPPHVDSFLYNLDFSGVFMSEFCCWNIRVTKNSRLRSWWCLGDYNSYDNDTDTETFLKTINCL